MWRFFCQFFSSQCRHNSAAAHMRAPLLALLLLQSHLPGLASAAAQSCTDPASCAAQSCTDPASCAAGAAMPLPPSAYLNLRNNLTVCRVTTGLWQVSGGHGYAVAGGNVQQALDDLCALIEAGFTSVDLADHYGPAEDLVGMLHEQRPEIAAKAVFLTKWVPRPGPMTRDAVLGALDVSRRRMRMRTLDLVQFHWWRYDDARYLDMVSRAQDLVREGVLRGVALTNFDTARLEEINSKLPVVSNQVSFSVVDTRVLTRMLAYMRAHDVALLAYGTLLGGLLSDAWLGAPEPRERELAATASLRKYHGFVRQWGSWELFQELLRVLRGVADKHGASVANVAVRYVVEHGAVALVGARVGLRHHAVENARVFAFSLDEEDLAGIQAMQAKGAMLRGEPGDEYR
jgi:aryl-alcohol dehydrogenase-like predicted oxidoreductase